MCRFLGLLRAAAEGVRTHIGSYRKYERGPIALIIALFIVLACICANL